MQQFISNNPLGKPLAAHPHTTTLFEARHYLGDYVDTPEYRFQELVRTAVATHAKPTDTRNGHAELDVLRSLFGVPRIRLGLCHEYRKALGLAIDAMDLVLTENPGANVKPVIDSLLRHFGGGGDKEGRLPWHVLPVSSEMVSTLQLVASEIRLRYEMVDGAICAVMQEEHDLRTAAYELLPQLAAAGLKPSPTRPYVPIVHHMTILENHITEKQVRDFMCSVWADAIPFTLAPTGVVQHCFSESCALFGVYVVMGFVPDFGTESTMTIKRVVQRWNATFPTAKVNVPRHIIIAVRPRGLGV